MSNFALAVIVAHYSSASALGVFAILTTTYVLSQGLVRSLSSDCLLTRSEADGGLRLTYERAGYLAAIVLSVALAALVLAVSGAAAERVHSAFVIFAVSFPLMACQDYARFIGISRYDPGLRHPPRRGLARPVPRPPTSSCAMQGSPACPGCSAPGARRGLWSACGRCAPSWRAGRRRGLLRFWDESERGVGLRFAGQFMLVTSWTYLISYLLLFVLSLSAIGEFKLSQLALGPITVLLAGLQSALIALAAKRFQVDTGPASVPALGALGAFALTLVWTGLVYAAPVHDMTTVSAAAGRRPGGSCPTPGWQWLSAAWPGPPRRGCAPCAPPARTSAWPSCMVPFLFVLCMGGAKLYGTRGRPAASRSLARSTPCSAGGCSSRSHAASNPA